MVPLAHWHIEAENGPLSAECVDRGIISFQSLIEWVEQLPYQRNANRANFKLVFDEEQGTCSTKHALVKAIADENGWSIVQLFLGQYEMSEATNPGIGQLLRENNLDFIPEAHVFLKIADKIIDLTGLPKGATSFELSLTNSHLIEPKQIGNYKLRWQEDILADFGIIMNKSLDELFKIRENCLLILSE